MTHYAISILILFSSLALAKGPPKHMIQVTTRGLGLGAGYEKTNPRSNSRFKEFDIYVGQVALNYAYSVSPQLQIGALFTNYSEEREYKTRGGEEGHISYDVLNIGLFGLWNFNADLHKSWYTGFMFSVLNREEETSNKAVFDFIEDDKSGETYEFIVGKRFNLRKWGFENITYSPSLSFYIQRARKDFDDDGLQDNMALNIEAIKFDVLF